MPKIESLVNASIDAGVTAAIEAIADGDFDLDASDAFYTLQDESLYLEDFEDAFNSIMEAE
jgi:hypothetical protein